MKIYDFNALENKSEWIEKIRICDWSAAKYLGELLEQNRFDEVLNGQLLIMTNGDNLVSFCTITRYDCINDDSLFPWIGFVFTAPEHRGHRHCGKLIEHACEIASEQGHFRVYLATDHIGLYEKYGFKYMESRADIHGEDSRIYYKEVAKNDN